MSHKTENTGFICQHCGKEVLPLTDGSYRNHCPFCLYSLHVDITPGDRACIHRCQKCGFERNNKINEDPRQPDDINAITAIMRQNAERR